MSITIKSSGYNYRTMLRFIVETTGPLAVGTGEKNVITDACVALDVNGLPYIPGTSIAGVLRHAMKSEDKNLWGFQERSEGHGSEIIVSEARVVNSKGQVMDGMCSTKELEDNVLKLYAALPIRQHVRINHQGTAENGAKFDNQIVPKGSRFCFEIEVLAKDKPADGFAQSIINCVNSDAFTLGSGTRNGYGQVEIVNAWHKELDLTQDNEREEYLNKSAALSDSAGWWGNKLEKESTSATSTAIYKLSLTPRDFFLFGSGMSSQEDDADMAPVMEKVIDWTTGVGTVIDKVMVIPATSVKGALRHRVAYHYNKMMGFTATKENVENYDINANVAVQQLFGYTDGKSQFKGKLVFSDVTLKDGWKTKILNHVSIDRFTGGAIDGALFSELAVYGTDTKPFEMRIILEGNVDDEAKKALKEALKDICKGMLPLGGGVNRGNGMFAGTLTINNEEETL